MGDIPVATIRFGSCGQAIFYIHTDHLNTPRVITRRSTQDVVWRWDSDPSGTTSVNENPAGLGAFAFNVRFPGQYYDAESGLNYNTFRHYDPETGRYVQSDPIGLAGGINTYSYVGGNPIHYTDANGQCPWCAVGGFVAGVGGYVIGTAIGGGEFSWRDAGISGLGGAFAGLTAGWGLLAEDSGSFVVGTGRAIVSALGEMGIDAGFHAYDVGDLVGPEPGTQVSSYDSSRNWVYSNSESQIQKPKACH